MSRQRWQYMTVKLVADGIFFPTFHRGQLEKKLAEMSEKGWELASSLAELGCSVNCDPDC